MSFTSFVCFVALGLAATTFAQIPEEFLIKSKLDGKILAIVEEIAPPAGGPYQRHGVVPVDGNSTNVDSWIMDNWDIPDHTVIYPLNETFRYNNALTIGLTCAQCFSYTHSYNVSQLSEDGSRLLRVVDGITEPNTCIKNEGEGEFITRVQCNENDDSQLWYFV